MGDIEERKRRNGRLGDLYRRGLPSALTQDPISLRTLEIAVRPWLLPEINGRLGNDVKGSRN